LVPSRMTPLLRILSLQNVLKWIVPEHNIFQCIFKSNFSHFFKKTDENLPVLICSFLFHLSVLYSFIKLFFLPVIKIIFLSFLSQKTFDFF
jgi:hypothetical protein